jgi:DNA-directed RNA polymerase subunit alpha
MSPDAMLRLAKLMEEAAEGLRLSAAVLKDLEGKIENPVSTPVSKYRLRLRARKALERLNITDLTQLEKVSGDEILNCRNTGFASLIEIRELMAKHGLYLRDERP